MDTALNILIVEDHDRLRGMLVQYLLQHDCHAVGVPDAEGMQQAMSTYSFDVVVLDLNLPDEDGLSIARRLRAASPNMFIVMLTARNSPSDRAAGYASGADVYIPKPSSGDELLAAVNAWRRRLSVTLQSSYSIKLKLQARELLGSQVVSLSAKESKILHALALAPGLTLEYFRLLEVIDTAFDTKGRARLEVYIARLRKKLEQAGFPAPGIKSIRNEGYQLVDRLVIL